MLLLFKERLSGITTLTSPVGIQMPTMVTGTYLGLGCVVAGTLMMFSKLPDKFSVSLINIVSLALIILGAMVLSQFITI